MKRKLCCIAMIVTMAISSIAVSAEEIDININETEEISIDDSALEVDEVVAETILPEETDELLGKDILGIVPTTKMEDAYEIKPGDRYVFSYTNGEVWCKFKAPAKNFWTRVTISNISAGMEMPTYLRNGIGEIISEGMGSRWTGRSATFEKKLEPGEYYYVTFSSWGPGNIGVKLEFLQDDEGEDFENAYELKEGADRHETTLAVGGDCDTYVFTAQHNCKYDVKLTSISPFSWYSSYFIVYSEARDKLGSNNFQYAGVTQKVTVSLEKGCKYYIQVGCNDAGKYSISVAPSNPFTDIPGDAWYYDAVAYAYDNDIMNGTSETIFSPNSNCQRSAMVQILYSADGKGYGNRISFTDVRSNDWFYNAVCWAVRTGVTSGKTATTFAPKENVTREQLAAFLKKYAEYKGYSTNDRKSLSDFPDGNKVSGWARDAVSWATAKKIINGRGSGVLDPKGIAKRSEVAQMMMSFQKSFGK